MVIDVDHFKSYNDDLGHQAGDRCLKSIAATLRGQFHCAGDVVTRYGGDEFMVLLPDTSALDAARLAVAATEHIRNLRLSHGRGADHPVVTISTGVATTTPGRADDHEELIAQADAALYAAKAAGRNAVRSRNGVPLPANRAACGSSAARAAS
jgi:diguanylate cyclase (GGDEF)-like protein